MLIKMKKKKILLIRNESKHMKGNLGPDIIPFELSSEGSQRTFTSPGLINDKMTTILPF